MAMKLTAKQEAFAVRVVAGDSLADAYRSAYPCKNLSDKSIWEHASHLAKNAKVEARIAELRKPVIDSAKYSLEEHLDQLRKLSLKAASLEQIQAAVRAEELRGTALGYYSKKVEISGPKGGPVRTQALDPEPDLSKLPPAKLLQLRSLLAEVNDETSEPASD